MHYLDKKCALENRVFQTEIGADFLERIVSAFRGFTVLNSRVTSYFFFHNKIHFIVIK